MSDQEQQLRAISLRLEQLEEAVQGLSRSQAALAAVAVQRGIAVPERGEASERDDDFFQNTVPQGMVPAGAHRADANPRRPVRRATPASDSDLSVTQVMGWTGATLLVLAAAYLIRLVYDAGWLTPGRQLWLAVLAGAALMAAGLKLRRLDKNYASLLPAGGLVVFFLAIYGAHLYYQLIGSGAAAAAVICNCLLALWLGRLFASEIYGLFAVLGSYSAPLLLPALSGSVLDLAIYFSAWSVVFSLYSVAIARRRPYLLAAYLALIAFHLAWEHMARTQWAVVVAFQTLQFAIFLCAAIYYSIRHASPMTHAEGLAHLPLLLLFYGLQYALLNRHLPDLAPWVALGSAAVLLLGYGVARRALNVSLEAGALIVGSYCAMVLFHAVYLELLPERWAPWVVVLALAPAAWYAMRPSSDSQLMLPFKVLMAGLLAINYVRVVLLNEHRVAGSATLLAFLFAAELYAAYWVGRTHAALRSWVVFALYAAHIGMMGVVLRIFDNALLVSLAWGALALASLTLAFRSMNQELGKSSLLIFAASLVKVILFDLADAAPLVRIGSLVVVGLSLYAGGLLYKRVVALER